MFKFVHAPGRDIPVCVHMTLTKDLFNEIYLWGLATLSDSEHWKRCMDETMRRGESGWTNRRFSHMLGLGEPIFDEYIFYFSNKDDAALFKLVWS